MTKTIAAFLAGLFLGMCNILWHLFYWAIIAVLSGVIVHLWR